MKLLGSASSFVEVLRHHATHAADEPACIFLSDGDTTEVVMTYAALDRQARAIATMLQDEGATSGDRALLLYPPGLEYVAGFFGCLYAGVVAVPAYPPDPVRLTRTLPRIQGIVADSRATIALTTGPILAMSGMVTEAAPDMGALRWLATDDLPPGEEARWRPPVVARETLAFLQYTSGSTGAPRGVMLTQANLLHNAEAISIAFEIDDESRGVTWLPPYHDMGLIGGILQPIFTGRPTVLMSPLAFLHRPMRWLRAISRTRATISGGPNFAFDICARKATKDDIAVLDLSSWSLAFSGAEPVRPETLRRFAAKFGDCGFRPEAFYPCYGLAEATLFVAGGRRSVAPVVRRFATDALRDGIAAPAALDAEGSSLVGCGASVPGQRIEIVKVEEGRVCTPGEVGEIWVSGASVAKGYWQLPELSESTFHARLQGDPASFLRTGDLGFISDGELFIAGRLKDMIIIRGRNYYPQDVERTVEECHPSMRSGCGAAFAVESGRDERLVIVQELERRHLGDRRTKSQAVGADRRGPDRRTSDLEVEAFAEPAAPLEPADVLEMVRQAIAERHELLVNAVVFIKAGSIPKTSSGKVQRHLCREGFLAGTLDVVFEWRARPTLLSDIDRLRPAISEPPPSTDDVGHVLRWLRARLARACRLDEHEIAVDQSITRYGIDSIHSVELVNEIENELGVVVSAPSLLRGPTLNELAAEIMSLVSRGAAQPIAPAGTDLVLSFAQERLWFLLQLQPESSFYNVPASIRLLGELRTDALAGALDRILERHAVLRTGFSDVGGHPIAFVAAPRPIELQILDLTLEREEDRTRALDRAASEEARRLFELADPPLLRALLIRAAPQDHVLVVTVHHIASDGWSMGVLVRELGAHYDAIVGGGAETLPKLPIQYSDYAGWERRELSGDRLAASFAYWERQLTGAPLNLSLPTDHPRPPLQSFRGRRHTAHLSRQLLDAATELARREGVTLYVTLLAAFDVALHRATAQDDLIVGCVTANRNRAQLEKLIGFFANTLPIRVELSGDPTFTELLHRVSRTTIDAFAHQELPFERLVEMLRPDRDLSRTPIVQVAFVLQSAPMPPLRLAGLTLSAEELDTRGARFDVLVQLWETEHGLTVSWEYASDLFEASTIEAFHSDFEQILANATRRPETRIGEIASSVPARTLTVAVAGTFTTEPVEPSLRFWFERFRVPVRIRFAPYDQVFQELLGGGVLAGNDAGVNIVLMRGEDWARDAAGALDPEVLRANMGSFRDALETFSGHSTIPVFLALCPPSDDVASHPRAADLRSTLDVALVPLRKMPSVRVIDVQRQLGDYGPLRVNDPHTDELGHIPYTREAYAVIGTILCRQIVGPSQATRLIAVECDGLLWGGHAAAPALSDDHAELQSVLMELQAKGTKICLVSRSTEAAVFDAIKGFGPTSLKLRHLASWRCDDSRPSEQLRAMAREQRVPLSSVAYLTATEESQRAMLLECPEAISLRVPLGSAAAVRSWLSHLWSLGPEPLPSRDARAPQAAHPAGSTV